MRRIAALLLVVAVGCAATLLTGGGGDGGYRLRAVFDNGSGLRTGMDVRVSGIEVGDVRSIGLDQSVPAHPRAVALIAIDDPAATDFRRDAQCAIRSATLLGDRFVDCRMTQKRRPGTPAPPPLATADGEHLLPVTRTSSPVDPDLFLDIFRLPVRQRLSIVINELGTGLAGSGAALRAAVHRADPAFLQLDRTLDILVQQRHALARLASASDRVLAPLARERDHIAGFVQHGNDLLGAVADRRAALRATFRRLPAFLAELRPTLTDLAGLAGQAGPALADLDSAAAQLSDATVALRPAAQAGVPGLRALGASAPAQQRGLTDVQPVLARLARLNPASRPVWGDLRTTLSSLRAGGGLDRLVELPMAIGLTSNGFDKYGYYSRTNAIITTCTSYVVARTSSCVGQFGQNDAPTADAKTSVIDYLLGSDG